MDYLPKDPAILVSSVNMLLRDEDFDTLEALCLPWHKLFGTFHYDAPLGRTSSRGRILVW